MYVAMNSALIGNKLKPKLFSVAYSSKLLPCLLNLLIMFVNDYA